MHTKLKLLSQALLLAAAPVFSSAASAQPIAVTVSPNSYRAAAIRVAPDGRPIIPVRRLASIGPYYVNPPNADYRRPIVLGRGSVVPAFVQTSLVENWNVPGLRPRSNYEYFVTERRRVVILTPVTRQVVRIVR